MKVLEYRGPRDLAWIDVADAQLQEPGDAVVRPLATATCDLDWQIVAGRTPFPAPFQLGHEFVGEVVAVGSDVARFAVGERVTVAFQPSCGRCVPCGEGETAACRSVAPTSMFGVGAVSGSWGGAFADLVRVPYADNMLAVAPAGQLVQALPSLSDNIADAYRTVADYLAADTQQRVLIFGDYDSIPLYAAAFALSLGAADVTYCTTDPRAAENARSLGANVELVTQWPKRLSGYDVTVCAVQSAAALIAAIRSTKAGGHCTSVSIFGQDIEFPIQEMYMRGVHFHTGRVNGAKMNQVAAQWLTAGLIEPLLIDTKVVPFADLIPELCSRDAAKVVAVPG